MPQFKDPIKQCRAITGLGTRCSNKVEGAFCYVHAKSFIDPGNIIKSRIKYYTEIVKCNKECLSYINIVDPGDTLKCIICEVVDSERPLHGDEKLFGVEFWDRKSGLCTHCIDNVENNTIKHPLIENIKLLEYNKSLLARRKKEMFDYQQRERELTSKNPNRDISKYTDISYLDTIPKYSTKFENLIPQATY